MLESLINAKIQESTETEKVDLLHLNPADAGCCCGGHAGHHCCGKHRHHNTEHQELSLYHASTKAFLRKKVLLTQPFGSGVEPRCDRQ